ncbi:MAG: hypothetical protein Q9163_006132 [Psora crenata]
MSSSVFFRFKSQKEPSRVTFDGTGISVFELKREIITQNKLGDGTDFELIITSEDTNEGMIPTQTIYDDDTSIIPRSTTVVARRLPATKAGRGGAARYVSGKMPQNAKYSHRMEAMTMNPYMSAMNGAQTEDERIAAMFKMGADDWAHQQQQMAHAAPVYRGSFTKGKHQNLPGHPPPPGYICYRCGEKGHWIMECPTNSDPTFDGRPRIKRTTGIPKSFLKTVDKPTMLINDGTIDDTKQPTGVMVNSEGEWVIAEPDQAAWDRYQAQAKVSAAAQNAAAQGSKELQDRGLECTIDKRLFVDPTKTPCCHSTYCHECIQNALLDNDLRCPQCCTDNVPIDDLLPDNEMAAKVSKYEEEKGAASVPTEEEARILIKQEQPGKSPEHMESKSRSGAEEPSTAQDLPNELSVSSKKRSAQSDLEDNDKTQGPAKLRSKHGLRNSSSANGPELITRPPNPNEQTQFPNNSSRSDSSALNATAFPNMSVFMGNGMSNSLTPPVGINIPMQNPMMMHNAPFMNNDWSNIWGTAFPQPNINIGGVFQDGVMYNGGFQQQNMQTPTAINLINSMGVRELGASGQFANQQRSNNEEESAYFRKPVNPNRQHNRRNWNQNRPADYREI